ncbi:M17 family metallopeptidase [Nocardioides salsibiostraticola]
MTQTQLPPQISPPQFALSELATHAIIGAEVIALAVFPSPDDGGTPLLGPGAAEVADELGMDLIGLIEALALTGKVGEVARVPVATGGPTNPDLRLIAFVGVGAARRLDVRRAGAALAREVKGRRSVATSIASLTDQGGIDAFVVGLMLGSFAFGIRSHEVESAPVGRVVLTGARPEQDADELARALVIGGAGWQARLLATVPSNIKNPPWLAEQAQAMAATAGLACQVWDENDLAGQGFGGLIGVGQASATPPRLIRMDYTPAAATAGAAPDRTVVLVGKGITFDTGGLSIKPGQSMATMKRDMSGGAVVMATMAALAEVGCPVRVVGLVAAAENAVSGNSLRPGDVIRHYGGRTSEVSNTDAEGRLVMADALAYAVSEVAPDVIVDVATLTGAVKVALGQQVGGIFSTHDELSQSLVRAGELAGEPLWPLPLHRGYDDKIASKVADADNGASGPGAILAALFLRHFVGDVPWAHLDLASVGDVPEDLHEWTTGPSGFGARLLLEWLGSPTPLAGVAATESGVKP